MPKRVKSAAAAADAASADADDAAAAEEAPRARKGDEAAHGRKAKRQKIESVTADEEGGEDDACIQEAIARHKTLMKKSSPRASADAAADDAVGDVATSEVQQREAGQRRDWAALRGEKREAKIKQKEANRDKEAEEARQQSLAAKAARNAVLRKKGKMTKKEKYKAAKAALKSKALEQTKSKVPSKGLEAQALANAGMERLDPRAVDCFLTGLPYMASEKHVQDHFAKVGPCKVELLRDSVTGKPSGKAFATFLSAEQALKAAPLRQALPLREASTYTGTKIQNRWIHVRLCEVRDTGNRRLNAGPTERPEGCLSAVVKCDKSVSEASLWKFFEDCGVVGVSRMMDRDTGEFRGMAFLDFEDPAMVDKAVAKSGHSIKGNTCFVRYKSDAGGHQKQDAGGNQKQDAGGGRVAAHNRAPPVPPPSGKATKFDDESDSDD